MLSSETFFGSLRKSDTIEGMLFLQIIRRKRSVRAFLAATFLFVLIAEWGSHAVVCSDEFHVSDAQAISATERGHDDPCQSLILCSDNKQKDQQVPKLGHDATQHNGLLDVFAALRPKLTAYDEPQIVFASTEELFRPPKPPFHPPKQA
jgi:hypothetical protein